MALREMIEKHIEIKNKLEKAAREVLYKNKCSMCIAKKYEIDCSKLLSKIQILQHKNIYIKEKIKFEAAISDYRNGNGNIQQIANQYRIDKSRLIVEIIHYMQCEKLNKEYHYDKETNPNKSISSMNFTYQQEKLFLELLVEKINAEKLRFPIDIFERLATFAYEFATKEQIFRKDYFDYWNIHKSADFSWLEEFEMRNTEKLYILCVTFNDRIDK